MNFQPLPGQSGDTIFSETQEAAYIENTIAPNGSSNEKLNLGGLVDGFLKGILSNRDAVALNNQAIAEYNLQQAAKNKEEGFETLILIFAMIVVFVLAVYAIKGKK